MNDGQYLRTMTRTRMGMYFQVKGVGGAQELPVGPMPETYLSCKLRGAATPVCMQQAWYDSEPLSLALTYTSKLCIEFKSQRRL